MTETPSIMTNRQLALFLAAYLRPNTSTYFIKSEADDLLKWLEEGH